MKIILSFITGALATPFRMLLVLRAARAFGWDCEILDPWELPSDAELLGDVSITRC